MKWYLCWSAGSSFRKDHDWENLIRVALHSAKSNTDLEPIVVVDGEPSPFTDEISRAGVRIIFHRVSFFDDLQRHYSGHGDNIHVAAGAFLRFDIPILEQEDEFVLYTDCDVIFFTSPNFLISEYPRLFSAAPQFRIGDYNDMNSGVMLLNVPGMRTVYPQLISFTKNNLNVGLDQEIMREFFKTNYTHLRPELNWKPYWGIKNGIQILHWHGPKPVTVKNFLKQEGFRSHDSWNQLFSQSPENYKIFEGIYSDMLIGSGGVQ
jgi:lipopolysaccharide biosynthesis glycosyltransferase